MSVIHAQGQKKTLGPLELALQMILTHPAWVLETELRSPGRAISSLNHWPSLQPPELRPFTWVSQRGKKICTGTLQNSVSEKFYEAINISWLMMLFQIQRQQKKVIFSTWWLWPLSSQSSFKNSPNYTNDLRSHLGDLRRPIILKSAHGFLTAI